MQSQAQDKNQYAYNPRYITLPTRFKADKYVLDVSLEDRVNAIKDRLDSGIPLVGTFSEDYDPTVSLNVDDIDFIVEKLNEYDDGTYSYTLKLVSDRILDKPHANVFCSYMINRRGDLGKIEYVVSMYIEQCYFSKKKVITISHLDGNIVNNYGYFLTLPDIDSLTNAIYEHIDINKFDIEELFVSGATHSGKESLLIDTISVGENNIKAYAGELDSSLYVSYENFTP